ncbi:MAG: hypothetical protein JKX94_02810 [Sneathiella sp.]|nr:hypothetical protein [Sneathiella sp.]
MTLTLNPLKLVTKFTAKPSNSLGLLFALISAPFNKSRGTPLAQGVCTAHERLESTKVRFMQHLPPM